MENCIFCQGEIEPEETIIKTGPTGNREGWLFQCDYCGAIYQSTGKHIPHIAVIEKPSLLEVCEW